MEFIISLLPLIVMGGLAYFMLIRPQQKQAKKKQDMLRALKPGDAVITIGGLHGIVDEVEIDKNLVVIDCEGVYLTFNLNAIATVKPSTVESHISVDDLQPSEENVVPEDTNAQ